MGVMIVTGGGRGIGAATARLAAARGYAVCVNYRRDAEAADAVVRGIEADGGRAVAVQADTGVEADIVRLFNTTRSELGAVTALVNNAADVGDGRRRIEDLTAAGVNRLLAVNVTGAILCAREAVRRMAPRHGGEGGAIVNVSSLAARHGAPGLWLDYAASKGALDTFTHGLAQEVADDGIRVNGVRPGLIDTEVHANAGMPDRAQRAGKYIPLKRAGQPEEVATAILWLLSDEASYVTGAVLDVGGGR